MVRLIPSLSRHPKSRPQIIQRGDYQPITKAIEVQGITIAAQSDSKINKALKQGQVIDSTSSPTSGLWKNIVVRHNDMELNVHLHDPNTSGNCSVDLSGAGKNVKTAISQTDPLNGNESKPVQAIKRAMTELHRERFGERRGLAQTIPTGQAT